MAIFWPKSEAADVDGYGVHRAYSNRAFADCSETQQKQILDRIAHPVKAAAGDLNAAAFFSHLRDLVVERILLQQNGREDLPYLGNTTVADREGRPPEVLASRAVMAASRRDSARQARPYSTLKALIRA